MSTITLYAIFRHPLTTRSGKTGCPHMLRPYLGALRRLTRHCHVNQKWADFGVLP
jgi:hypothetical protein